MSGTDPGARYLGVKVALLCIASGSLDAVTVLAIGEAFASVMTGNMVLLGVAAGTADGTRALACAIALGGYVTGGMIGSRLTSLGKAAGEGVWAPRVTRTFALEAGILSVIGILWALDTSPSRGMTFALLGLAAAAMGMQGAAIRQVGVAVSTTYMTGALTGLAEAVALRTPFTANQRHGTVGLVSLLSGALLGGLLVHTVRSAALLLPLIAVLSVIVLSLVVHRSTSRDSPETFC